MNLVPRRPRSRTRLVRALTSVVVLASATLSAGLLSASAAHADVAVHTIVPNVTEAWGPYQSSVIGEIIDNGSNITISCYVTGQSVSGPYGTENVWDEVSGGTDLNSGASVETGVFAPDADLWTGSNTPVVPPCGTALGQIIGGNWVNMYGGPSQYGYTPTGPIDSGTYVEIKCYSTGEWMSGPYGSENIWDLITATIGGANDHEWVPDALVYTGSNSAVVPLCPPGETD